jgi:hypothetical protein
MQLSRSPAMHLQMSTYGRAWICPCGMCNKMPTGSEGCAWIRPDFCASCFQYRAMQWTCLFCSTRNDWTRCIFRSRMHNCTYLCQLCVKCGLSFSRGLTEQGASINTRGFVSYEKGLRSRSDARWPESVSGFFSNHPETVFIENSTRFEYTSRVNERHQFQLVRQAKKRMLVLEKQRRVRRLIDAFREYTVEATRRFLSGVKSPGTTRIQFVQDIYDNQSELMNTVIERGSHALFYLLVDEYHISPFSASMRIFPFSCNWRAQVQSSHKLKNRVWAFHAAEKEIRRNVLVMKELQRFIFKDEALLVLSFISFCPIAIMRVYATGTC